MANKSFVMGYPIEAESLADAHNKVPFSLGDHLIIGLITIKPDLTQPGTYIVEARVLPKKPYDDGSDNDEDNK